MDTIAMDAAETANSSGARCDPPRRSAAETKYPKASDSARRAAAKYGTNLKFPAARAAWHTTRGALQKRSLFPSNAREKTRKTIFISVASGL